MKTRGRPEGIRHRAELRRLVVPRLFIGATVPTSKFLAKVLGIQSSEALRHMKIVLAEDGFDVRRQGIKGRPGTRLVVHRLPVEYMPMRAAA